MELKEGDIPKINAILSEAMSGYVLADVATLKKLGMTKDEFAYYQQLIVSHDLGAFRKDGYHSLGPNYNTAVALRDDWVKGMFDRQEEGKKIAALENRRLKLEVRNGEWEKRRYWITTLIAVAALIVSICSLRAKL